MSTSSIAPVSAPLPVDYNTSPATLQQTDIPAAPTANPAVVAAQIESSLIKSDQLLLSDSLTSPNSRSATSSLIDIAYPAGPSPATNTPPALPYLQTAGSFINTSA